MARDQVLARSRDTNGNVMGRSNTNPILDTRIYQVIVVGGEVTVLTANIIAESMYTQCNSEGNEYLLLDALIDYQRENKAISLSDQEITVWDSSVNTKTSAGWQISCQWKDNSTSSEKLSELKESHPVQTAEFAVVQRIDHEQVFNWWDKHVLKKVIIIASIRKQQTRYLKKPQVWCRVH